MKILLVTPPLTQLNTPYPATAHLTGFLRSKEIEAVQMDLSIEWIHTLFTPQSLKSLFDLARRKSPQHPHPFMQHADFCLQKITTVMRFLSGRDRTLAHRLARPEEWYDSRRKPAEEELEWAYGTMGIEGKAQLFCTLFLRDLCDFIRSEIDPNFELIRYAEKICTRLPHFHKLHQQLQQAPGALEEQILSLLRQRILQEQPEWIGFAVPFPGNLWSTLRCCQMIKKEFGSIQIVMGGGYVNTELRQLSDATLFDYIDYLTFDDGELPLWRLLSGGPLLRTITRQPNGELKFHQIDSKEQIPFAQLSAPDYGGLTDNAYLNLIEFCNPMHALWGNGQWNKMMLSHGCYWAKCAFCDVTLDYIKRFEPAKASSLVDRMERIMEQTGEPGFHFVDEAASPQILRQLSEEIIRRGLTVTYWTNIRFEKVLPWNFVS